MSDEDGSSPSEDGRRKRREQDEEESPPTKDRRRKRRHQDEEESSPTKDRRRKRRKHDEEESSPTKDGKKGTRKKNFSSAELRILVDAILRHEYHLHGPGSNTITQAKKLQIQGRVARKLNVLGVEHRSAQDVRKRWNDLTRRTRFKLAQIRRHQQGTGGGPPCTVQLSDIEKEVATVLRDEQTHGLDGVDTAEPAKEARVQQAKRRKTADMPSTSAGTGTGISENAYVLQSIVSRLSDSEDDATTGDVTPPLHGEDARAIEGMLDDAEQVIQEELQSEMVVWMDDSDMPAVSADDQDASDARVSPDEHTPHRSVSPPQPTTPLPRSQNTDDPAQPAWDNQVLVEQGKQTGHIAELTRTVKMVHQEFQHMTQAVSDTGAESSRVLHAIQDAVVDEATNTCALVAGVCDTNQTLEHMKESLSAIATNTDKQAQGIEAMVRCMQEQTQAINALTCETKALVSAIAASNALREASISTGQSEGRHTRRVMRGHARQDVTLHNATTAQLARIGTDIELMQTHSEPASRSTTPSVEESAPGSAVAPRQLRSRTRGVDREKGGGV